MFMEHTVGIEPTSLIINHALPLSYVCIKLKSIVTKKKKNENITKIKITMKQNKLYALITLNIIYLNELILGNKKLKRKN